jgi:hypothetical protein
MSGSDSFRDYRPTIVAMLVHPVKTSSRDEFSMAVKRILAQRVGLLCSNPSCRAETTGPQSDPSGVVNVGVAAHITAAAQGGPRFDLSLSEKERRSATNGIWLCQNCAKLIDSDLEGYASGLLRQWKAVAEEETRRRIGKTHGRASVRSNRQAVAALKRDQKMRDDLTRDLLKTISERMGLSRGLSRTAKFLHSEVIIHRIDDVSYPDVVDSPGISGWFKLEVLDFYHGGLECILRIREALHDSATRKWSLITYEQSSLSFPVRFSKMNVIVTGKIPWRNILHYDMRGDRFYPEPHLYCAFADSGMPYEGWGYFLAEKGYEWELSSDDKLELEALLKLAESS